MDNLGVLTRFPLYLFGLKKPKRMPFQSLTQQQAQNIYFSLIGIFGGTGLLLSYFVEKKELDRLERKEDEKK